MVVLTRGIALLLASCGTPEVVPSGVPNDASIGATDGIVVKEDVPHAPISAFHDPCSDGYYIDVVDSVGTTTLRGGLNDAGVPQTMACALVGEDCFSAGVAGTNEASTLVLALQNGCGCPPIELGKWNGRAMLWTNTSWYGDAKVRVLRIDAQAVTGDYVTTVGDADGGTRQLHGTFCVRP